MKRVALPRVSGSTAGKLAARLLFAGRLDRSSRAWPFAVPLACASHPRHLARSQTLNALAAPKTSRRSQPILEAGV